MGILLGGSILILKRYWWFEGCLLISLMTKLILRMHSHFSPKSISLLLKTVLWLPLLGEEKY